MDEDAAGAERAGEGGAGSAGGTGLAVVVSHWTGHPRRYLRRLLGGMRRHDPGVPVSLCVACNGGDRAPLEARDLALFEGRIVNRENRGYNIGAWDAGFRAMPGFDAYLFLQSECVIRRPGWGDAFAFRLAHDPGVGVLGEAVMWDRMGWDYIKRATARDLGRDPAEAAAGIDFYRAEMARRGIPAGPEGTHVQSLVMAIRGDLLRAMDGLPTGESYEESVACEVAISRRAEAMGYRVARVSDRPFRYVGHPQWTPAHQAWMRVHRRLRPLRDALRPLRDALGGRR
jgi:hypothetical protein